MNTRPFGRPREILGRFKDKALFNLSLVFGSIKKAASDLVSNPKNLLLVIVLDFAFLILYGFVSSAYLQRINDFLTAAGSIAMTGTGVKAMTQDSSPSFLSLFFNPQTQGHFINVLILFLLFGLSAYILVSFLFGLSTFLSFSLNKSFRRQKDESVQFVKKMFFIMFPWFVIYIINELLSFYSYVISTISRTLGIQDSSSFSFGFIFTLLFGYFVLISLSLDKKRNFRSSIILGIRKSHILFLIYLILFAGFAAISYVPLLYPLIFHSPLPIFISYIYVIFIGLGFIAFSRRAFKICLDMVVKN